MTLKEQNSAALWRPNQPVWLEPTLVAQVSSVPVNTIRSWARRGVIVSACDLETGLLMVNMLEVQRRAGRLAACA